MYLRKEGQNVRYGYRQKIEIKNVHNLSGKYGKDEERRPRISALKGRQIKRSYKVWLKN